MITATTCAIMHAYKKYKNGKTMTLQKKATVVASTAATALIFIKMIIGIMSGSIAVLASAIDSVLDLIVSAFNYFAISKSEKPADAVFNYGRGKVEALAAVIEGAVVTASGLYILFESVRKAYNNEPTELLGISITAMLISLVITISLVLFLNYVAKKTKSMVVKSDALHYKTDVYTNGAILVGLVLINITGIQIIDSILGIAIAIYIIYASYELIKEGVLVLLDASIDKEIVEKIKDIIVAEPEATSYHFLKTRKAAKTNFVDVHIVFNTKISLLEAHDIGDKIEDKIAAIDKEDDWVITMHLDPKDDSISKAKHEKVN